MGEPLRRWPRRPSARQGVDKIRPALEGLRPDIEFYLFVTYTDQAGKLSRPSPPLAFKLKNRFGYN